MRDEPGLQLTKNGGCFLALLKIISGGQTGVDRGALDAAIKSGSEHGGTCPAARQAEDGKIPDRYRLVELSTGGYSERTERNVADGDATLILHGGGPITSGTQLTADCCRKLQKPHLLLDMSSESPASAVAAAEKFLQNRRIKVLNVAGPRASEWPAAYQTAYAVVSQLLQPRSGHPGRV
jgi:Circularly permutated YpsA SLOG family